MKRLIYSFETVVEFSVPVTDHAFVLRCLPSSVGSQRANAQLDLEPNAPFTVERDAFGNQQAVGLLEEPHGRFRYCAHGRVTVDAERGWREDAHPMYRFESPLTHVSDEMRAWIADAAHEAGASPAPGTRDALTLAQCERLMHLVHDTFRYQPGSTHVRTTAAEAFDQRTGVCQDFAHVLCALLRALGTPARYASGLTVGEGATHAWAQAHVDGRWVGLDPTRNTVTGDDYIVCAVGRDWSDCPIERGTFHGAADQTQTVFMHVEEQ